MHERPPGSKRKRSRKACEPCRRRKKRCCGGNPCQACCDFEYTCFYDSAQWSQSTKFNPPDGQPSEASPILSPAFTIPDGAPNFSPIISSDLEHPAPFPNALGIRCSLPSTRPIHLTALMCMEEALGFSKTYFEKINRRFAIIDPDSYFGELHANFRMSHNGDEPDVTSSALLAFVVVLGSLFAWPEKLRNESELAQKACSTLDHLISAINTTSERKCIQASILRSIYLRNTGNYGSAWLASCQSLNLIEMLSASHPGLIGPPALPEESSGLSCAKLTSLIWLAWAINRMFSLETSCHPANFTTTSSCPPLNTSNSTSIFIHTIQAFNEETSPLTILQTEFRRFELEDSLLIMIRAHLLCLLYWKPQSSHLLGIDSQIIDMGRRGLIAAKDLIENGEPWWQIVDMPFQLLNVLLEMRNYGAIPQILSVLDSARCRFGTSAAQEVLDKARDLVRDAVEKRDSETAALKLALASPETPPPSCIGETGNITWSEYLNEDALDVNE